MKLKKKVRVAEKDTTTSTTKTTSTTSTSISNIKTGDKYKLKNNTPGYYTSADAKAGKDQCVSILADEYIIYHIAKGMINITKVKGKPGLWINPNKVK